MRLQLCANRATYSIPTPITNTRVQAVAMVDVSIVLSEYIWHELTLDIGDQISHATLSLRWSNSHLSFHKALTGQDVITVQLN
jgi:hypothetical protein